MVFNSLFLYSVNVNGVCHPFLHLPFNFVLESKSKYPWYSVDVVVVGDRRDKYFYLFKEEECNILQRMRVEADPLFLLSILCCLIGCEWRNEIDPQSTFLAFLCNQNKGTNKGHRVLLWWNDRSLVWFLKDHEQCSTLLFPTEWISNQKCTLILPMNELYWEPMDSRGSEMFSENTPLFSPLIYTIHTYEKRYVW